MTDTVKSLRQKALTRRNLLDWLGRGCVLALSGSAIASFVNETSCSAESAGPEGLAFNPGRETGPIFEDWPERTVDRQDLKKIIATWRLKIGGMVESPKTLSFAETIGLPRTNQVTDFHCVEGWSVLDVPWNGVHLSEIFKLVKPKKEATHVVFHTVGGKYNGSLPIEWAIEPKTILAYGVSGSTLPLPHGFPLRVVIPRMYGYKNVKYVERIELADKPLHSYWVNNGYPYDGGIPKKDLREGKY